MTFFSKKLNHPKPPIAVDFDGVIHAYSKGFYDGSIYDSPMEGVVEALGKLKEKYFIYVYSSRTGDTEGKRAVEDFLIKYKIPYDEVYSSKPPAKFYIDDRAIRFKNWDQTIDDLGKFEEELKKLKANL